MEICETPRENGYVTIAVCYLSRFVVVRAVAYTSSEIALSFFRRKIINQFGILCRIISDQGTAFTSRLWASSMNELEIQHSFASAERAQTNGLVEKIYEIRQTSLM